MATQEQTRTAMEAVEAYDRGEILWTVEMGGLGPGYEQCIQVLVMEIIRKLGAGPLPEFPDGEEGERQWWHWADDVMHEADRALNLGLSGAQAGAAKSLAYRAIRDGWDAMVASAPEERRIQFSKHFPGQPRG